MYLHLELKTMATDRLTEAVERLHYLHTLMASVPGFLDAQICEYLGNPAQYLVLRAWADQESHTVGYRQSQAAKDFAASRPAGFIYDNLAVEEWNAIVDETPGPGGPYVVRRLYSEEERRSVPVPQTATSLRIYRRLGSQATDGLHIERWPSRDAYAGFLQTLKPGPQVGLVECYAVVDEVRGQ